MTSPPFVAVAHQTWLSLTLAHWRVPPVLLRAHLPAGVALDTHDGDAWLSLVAFAVRGMRPRFVPSALGLDFGEVNLRTYVTWKGERAIWVFSADLASAVAHAGYGAILGEAARRAHIDIGDASGAVEVRGRRGDGRLRLSGRADSAVAPSDALDRFLLDRFLQVSAPRPSLFVGARVRHAPIEPRTCSVELTDEGWSAPLGLPPLSAAPERAHYTPRVDVDLAAPRPLRTTQTTRASTPGARDEHAPSARPIRGV